MNLFPNLVTDSWINITAPSWSIFRLRVFSWSAWLQLIFILSFRYEFWNSALLFFFFKKLLLLCHARHALKRLWNAVNFRSCSVPAHECVLSSCFLFSVSGVFGLTDVVVLTWVKSTQFGFWLDKYRKYCWNSLCDGFYCMCRFSREYVFLLKINLYWWFSDTASYGI